MIASISPASISSLSDLPLSLTLMFTLLSSGGTVGFP